MIRLIKGTHVYNSRAISQLTETRELHQQCRTRILELDAELAETREQLAQAQTQLDTSPYDLVPEALQQRDSALEQLTETRGIARELAEALERRQHDVYCNGFNKPISDICCCGLSKLLRKAKAAGILNAPEGVGG